MALENRSHAIYAAAKKFAQELLLVAIAGGSIAQACFALGLFAVGWPLAPKSQ
jgi:hypothetical protein